MGAQVFMLDWLWNVKRWTLKKKFKEKRNMKRQK